jgi:pyruvate dehydrogenase E1 component alpha subunit
MTPKDVSPVLSQEQLLRIYRDMVRTRVLDEQMIKDANSGSIPPGWHSGLGEEVIVGPVSLLRKDDYVTYTHRGAYQWIAKGVPMKDIIAEFYAKATGSAFGKGGTHIVKPSIGIMGRWGEQGGHFPLAAGMAIAAQLRGEGQVSMMFFGDGCGCRGPLHEAMNQAAVWKLPVIWINENNGQSMSVRSDRTWAIKDISQIAASYGMPGKTVYDGNDVVAVTEAAKEMIDRARNGGGPSLLEIKTFRWRGHNEGDAQRYRTRQEIAEGMKNDCVKRFEANLMDAGILTARDVEATMSAAEVETAEAQKFAEDSPFPKPEDAFTTLYSKAARV